MASKRESSFVSIGDCPFCGNTGMELFYTSQGLACFTCCRTIKNEAVQIRTAKRFQRDIQYLRNRLNGHGGH
jgi:hypothetical protein